jgi:hypothetical protein
LNGYCPLEAPTGKETLAAFNQLIVSLRVARSASASSTSTLQNLRLALNLSKDAPGKLKDAIVSVFVGKIGEAAAGYIGDKMEVQGVQDITILGACPPQELHRDHQVGKAKAIVLALSLDDLPLGTEFVRATHRIHEDPAAHRLSEYIINNRYSTRRAPKVCKGVIQHWHSCE